MVESVSGSPLLRWTNRSTATLVENHTASGAWDIYVDKQPGALGGGCLAPPDGAKLKALEELAQEELPAAEAWIDKEPPARASCLLTMFQETPPDSRPLPWVSRQKFNRSFPWPRVDFSNLTIPVYDCPVSAGNITDDWFAVVAQMQASVDALRRGILNGWPLWNRRRCWTPTTATASPRR